MSHNPLRKYPTPTSDRGSYLLWGWGGAEFVNETVLHLLRAVHRDPADHTLWGALADALDEAHPQGKDGHALILREAMNSPQHPENQPPTDHGRGDWSHGDYTMEFPPTEGHPSETTLITLLRRGRVSGQPYFAVRIGAWNQDKKGWWGDGMHHLSPLIGAEVPHAKAREIADALPGGGTDYHNELSERLGTDPRFEQINQALKPDADS